MNKLYKKDSNGNIRVWYQEVDGGKYRTHSGVLDGKIVISGWKYTESKNTGKTNETTPEQQAFCEVESKYEYQLTQGKYYNTIEEAHVSKPRYFSPMLAKKYGEADIHFPVYAQPKLDGVRCIATSEGLFSRNGKPLVATPHISESIEEFFDKYPDAILDGELYAHKYKDNFDKIISLARKTKPKDIDLVESEVIEYHIYDIPDSGSFHDRFANSDMLSEIKNLISIPCIKLVETVLCKNLEDLDSFYGTWMEEGYEGQMIRAYNSLYEEKRSKGLLKRKEFQEDEFEIVSIDEGKGNWAGYAKTCHIKLANGEVQKASLRGTFGSNKELLNEAAGYIGGDVTIRWQNATPDGKLRFPVAIAFYKGKRDT